MTVNILIGILSTLVMVLIALGGLVWRLASKLQQFETTLSLHIESSKEWRQSVKDDIAELRLYKQTKL